ncbi:MAG: ribosome small subunit-dependent GTPase A [Dehalococcoidaceae bacterium]|nr:ribosome small subunit-dependent GTPase A [Dehalococcoidaceae bacterium]
MISPELTNLGFDNWFQHKLGASNDSDFEIARISSVNRDNYQITNGRTEAVAELSGQFRFSLNSEIDLPTVGDWVLLSLLNEGTLGVILSVLPRKTVLKRKAAGSRVEYQLIAANIDTAFIIQPCDSDFNPSKMERYLVAVREGGIEPVILLSKSDLAGPETLKAVLDAAGELAGACSIITYSAESGFGLNEIYRLLKRGKTFCLLGSSGAGKTTLINQLAGEDAFSTGTVREKDGKGRHTTTRRYLSVLEGGTVLIDTPGLREFGNIEASSGLASVFAEIEQIGEGCRFRNCSHTGEDGCLVMQALNAGRLKQERYENYLKLKRESARYQMSYAEKRKKDKLQGRMYKAIMKQKTWEKPRDS